MRHLAAAAAFTVVVGGGVRGAAGDEVLAAGRDVARPRRLHAPPAAYPRVARQAAVQGLIVLEVTLREDGVPSDIEVLRGIPLLDLAAITTVRRWRYEPTLVEGVPRRVELVETIEFFLSDGAKARSYRDLALDGRQPSGLRVFAVSQLVQLAPKQRKIVVKTLEQLAEDPEQDVAHAAASGLSSLQNGTP